MRFFNYTLEPDRTVWSVPSQFWVYWACAVPLTCLTLALAATTSAKLKAASAVQAAEIATNNTVNSNVISNRSVTIRLPYFRPANEAK